MSLKVVTLEKDPHEEVVDTLERWLDWAKKGELRSLLLLGIGPDEVLNNERAGPNADAGQLMLAFERWKYRCCVTMDDAGS